MGEKDITPDEPTKPASVINEAPQGESSAPGLKGRFSIIWRLIPGLLGLAWLAPIIALLVLNFEGYVAGASVACGVEHCDVWYGFNATGRLDTQNHDILGSLQLVAKALEAWFIFLAGCLVYNVTMMLAKRGDGLPIRYLMTHKEFGELIGLWNVSFWTTASKPANDVHIKQSTIGSTGSQEARTRKRTLWGFILFVAATAIISNLMGPATAVLLIPSLGWKEISVPQTQAFDQLASSNPPSNPDIGGTCSSTTLAAGDYSCTADFMQIPLDTMLANIALADPDPADFSASEGFCVYSFNFTDTLADGSPVLAPSRQTMVDLTNDFNDWEFSTSSVSYAGALSFTSKSLTQFQWKAMRNAVQVQRQRQAPAVSSSVQCYGTITIVQVSEGKSVHCYDLENPDIIGGQSGGDSTSGTIYPYDYYSPSNANSPGDSLLISTMCIRIGSGWHTANAHSTFSIATSLSGTDSVEVDVYSSDRAIYLNSTTYNCLSAKDPGKSCNWDAMFLEKSPPKFNSTSGNLLVTEYRKPGGATAWCRSFAYLKFPTYLLDTSPSTNPNLDVLVNDDTTTPSIEEAISVHPAWILAAWSVNENGVVPYTRLGAQTVKSMFPDTEYDHFSYMHNVIVSNGLSMIDYSMKTIDASTTNSPTRPVFKVSILSYIWSYGVDSGTSKLGVVVAIAGCIFVLLHAFISLRSRYIDRSLINFVLVALEQPPPKIFARMSEEDAERVRVRIMNREDWKYEFGREQI